MHFCLVGKDRETVQNIQVTGSAGSPCHVCTASFDEGHYCVSVLLTSVSTCSSSLHWTTPNYLIKAAGSQVLSCNLITHTSCVSAPCSSFILALTSSLLRLLSWGIRAITWEDFWKEPSEGLLNYPSAAGVTVNTSLLHISFHYLSKTWWAETHGRLQCIRKSPWAETNRI